MKVWSNKMRWSPHQSGSEEFLLTPRPTLQLLPSGSKYLEMSVVNFIILLLSLLIPPLHTHLH